MKSTIANTLIFSLLATTISAIPTTSRFIKVARQHFAEITVQLSNDQTGRNADATILADAADNTIDSLFGNSAVAENGEVFASSAQLVAFQQSTICTIKLADGKVIATLNAQTTFVDLDGDATKAVPVELDGAVINCGDY